MLKEKLSPIYGLLTQEVKESEKIVHVEKNGVTLCGRSVFPNVPSALSNDNLVESVTCNECIKEYRKHANTIRLFPSMGTRVVIHQGNPIIKTEKQLSDYNRLCELVIRYGVDRVVLASTHLEISVKGLHISRYGATTTVDWVKGKLDTLRKDFEDEYVTMPVKQAKELVKSVFLKLAEKPTIKKEGDNITFITETSMASFKLSKLPWRIREKIKCELDYQRLSLLAKEIGV